MLTNPTGACWHWMCMHQKALWGKETQVGTHMRGGGLPLVHNGGIGNTDACVWLVSFKSTDSSVPIEGNAHTAQSARLPD